MSVRPYVWSVEINERGFACDTAVVGISIARGENALPRRKLKNLGGGGD